MMRSSRAMMLGAVLCLTAGQGFAQQLAPLPWSVDAGDYIMIGVQWDEAVVRNALPAGVKAAADLSGAISLYKTDGGFGSGAYDGAYPFVNIEDFDSADGSKGRWMMQGAYGPSATLATFLRETYGWPVRTGQVTIEETVTGKRATLAVGGVSVLEVNANISPLPCAPANGVANFVGEAKSAGKFNLHEIPFSGQWCGAEPISVKVTAPSGDPFAGFVPAKILWAGLFKNGVWAFSKPVVH